MRVVVDRDRYALCLTVRFSKTLKYQQKVHEVWITGDRSPTALLDPVRLWQGYVAAVPAEPSDPAFCFHAEDGSLQPLDFTLLAAGIKSLIAAIGTPAIILPTACGVGAPPMHSSQAWRQR